jgi:hypothetical protein
LATGRNQLAVVNAVQDLDKLIALKSGRHWLAVDLSVWVDGEHCRRRSTEYRLPRNEKSVALFRRDDAQVGPLRS